MKILILIVILFLASCGKPTTLMIGMSEADFKEMCKPGPRVHSNGISSGAPATTIDKDGITHVYDLRSTEEPNSSCRRLFTFVNGKLTSMSN